jgi:hypothetical protein
VPLQNGSGTYFACTRRTLRSKYICADITCKKEKLTRIAEISPAARSASPMTERRQLPTWEHSRDIVQYDFPLLLDSGLCLSLPGQAEIANLTISLTSDSNRMNDTYLDVDAISSDVRLSHIRLFPTMIRFDLRCVLCVSLIASPSAHSIPVLTLTPPALYTCIH